MKGQPEIEETRLVTPIQRLNEETTVSLRPISLDDYMGQDQIKEKLSIFIEAASKREDALDHVLLSGPPGLGKTTLAHIVAQEMGVAIKVTSGPVIQKAGDLAAILTHLQPHDILFIDEIHRLSRNIEEILYPALEDFQLDILIGKGPSAQSVRLKLKEFTLIGATTQTGRISSPLRTRCGIILRLGYYSTDDLCCIVIRAAKTLEIDIDKRAAIEIAGRSRGTPRIALRLLRRVRDYAQVRGDGKITLAMAKAGLKMMEIDNMGLDLIDHQMIKTIMDFHNGGPVGLETIALTLGEDVNTISDVYEPYLLQIGFLRRTARGRTLTPAAYHHFDRTPPNALIKQSGLIEAGPVQDNFDFATPQDQDA